MSVVAFDGVMMAADKQATCNGIKILTTKIWSYPDYILAITGDISQGILLRDWFLKGGPNYAPHPSFQDDRDDWCRLIEYNRIDKKLYFYERHMVRIPVEETFSAFGSGRDFAIGAMAVGASAVTAVEIANKYCDSCGLGVDVYYV